MEKYIPDRGPGAWPVLNSHLRKDVESQGFADMSASTAAIGIQAHEAASMPLTAPVNFEPDQRALFPELSICSSVEVDVTQRLSALTIPGRYRCPLGG